jgi:hypothetical protein
MVSTPFSPEPVFRVVVHDTTATVDMTTDDLIDLINETAFGSLVESGRPMTDVSLRGDVDPNHVDAV